MAAVGIGPLTELTQTFLIASIQMGTPCSGPERADLQIAVRISRREDIKLVELLLSARRKGFIYTDA